jgi:hypothetical protein
MLSSKGGDEQESESEDCSHLLFQQYLCQHPIWRGEDEESVFNVFLGARNAFGVNIQPFVHFQMASSKVCFLVSAPNAIYYYMLVTTGTPRDAAINQYAINIGQFMRNHFSPEETFQTIFCLNGGYPVHVLDSLLTTSVTSMPDGPRTKTFDIDYDWPAMVVFQVVGSQLKKTVSILVSDFRIFPGYNEITKTEFSGNWDDWKDKDAPDMYHAFLIVGVAKTEGMGGIKFLVQDSSPGRPFVTIGIDLFASMGVKGLHCIEDGVVFPGATDMNALTGISMAFSGSPMVSKDNKAPDITSAQNDPKANPKNPDWVGFELPPGADYSNLVVRT